MKRKQRFLFPLLMAMVMTAMSPQKVWATNGTMSTTTIDGKTFYQISDRADLDAFCTMVGKGSLSINGILTADVDCNNTALTNMRIGDGSHHYKGIFNGNNKTIKNFYIPTSGWERALFGYTEGATIKNLTVTGALTATANGTGHQGSVVGKAAGGSVIENVTSSVNINIIGYTGYYYVGGIVGECDNSTIRNCAYTGTIKIDKGTYGIGGIAGDFISGGQISGCTFGGKILLQGGDAKQVGGIAGYAKAGTISDCGSTGTIQSTSTGTCSAVGGIVGQTEGTIDVSQCWGTGTVDAGNGYDCIGGIVGFCVYQTKLKITSCCFMGTLKSNNTTTNLIMGGILGAVNDDNGGYFQGISNCFAAPTFTYSGSSSNIGGIAGIIKNKAATKVTNNYYDSNKATRASNTLNGTLGTNYGRTTAQCNSGQVCYELNNSVSGGTTWRQNITSGTVDSYPVLDQTHNTVYLLQDKYCTGSNYGSPYYSNNTTASSDHHTFTSQTVSDTYKKSDATCTADAVYYYKCSGCAASSKDKTNTTWTNTGSHTGHNLKDTWTWSGSKPTSFTLTCQTANCGYSFTNSKLGNATSSVEQAATCTEMGKTRYSISVSTSNGKKNQTFSSYTILTDIDALGHDYTSQTVSDTYKKSDATCIAAAVYYYKCSRCTANEKNDNHTFTNGSITGHSISLETGLCSTCSTDLHVTTSYRKPTYKTAGDAKSGIKSWETVSDVVAIPLPSSTTRQTWYGKTYVVQNGQTVNLTGGAICSGAVNLIVEDGATLYVESDATNNAAINVTGSNSLTINGQQNNSGKVVAHTRTLYGSAIGGNYKQEGSNITINGGDITAWAYSAAGIGGGDSGVGHDIIINGGTIQAQDKDKSGDGSGIGGGYYKGGYNIFINGGTTTATGGSKASGIGGGQGGSVYNIFITGGTITATGGSKASGIGAGYGGHGYDISITGGTITATGGSYAAGIGGGYQSYGYNISITGGTITATGQDGADAIGYGSGVDTEYAYKNITFAPKMGILNGTTVITNTGGDMFASIHGKSAISVHEHTGFTYNNDAGCKTAGTMTTSCSTCNLDKVTITDPEHPVLGHAFDDDTDPTHEVCTRCDHYFLYYTTNNNSIIKDNHPENIKDADGNTFVSNTYVDGKGIYEFGAPVTIIGEKAFDDKYFKITGITIPSTVTNIGQYAFDACRMTGSIVIPESVKRFNGTAFDGCNKLSGVEFHSVPLFTDAMTYSGDITLKLNDDSYVYTGSNLNLPTFTSNSTYSRTMTSEWGTLIVPFDVSETPEGFEFYSIRNLIGGNTLYLDKITGTIEAGTPIFVRRTGEGTSLSLTASSGTVNTAITTASGTALQGTYSSVNLTKAANPNDYFLYSNQLYSTSKLGNENYATIRPFRAYLTTSAASEAKLQIAVEEETTSLTPTLSQGEGAMSIYNLNGQKLAAPHKGINIINGKKVLVK